MINKFFFTISLFTGFVFHAQNLEKKVEIALQDFFNGDKVSVRIGKCKIFENKILTSSDTGFGGVIGEFYEPNKMLITFYGGKRNVIEKKCNLDLSKDLVLYLRLNDKKSILHVNLHDGKYIGLSKGKNNDFKLLQQNRGFQYD
ncbi:hypothetical protein [Chryseobacterium sp. JK1]|uniref:hypothetical protein n=1 Tax=Chryseobacterium sp. JK1 TaxID=874294 RepID=UPI003D69234A